MIIPLEEKHVKAWISLHREFYSRFAWGPNINEERVRELITKEEDTTSWVLIDDRKITAIGTLIIDDKSKGIIQDFAFSPEHIDNALELLRHLIAIAKKSAIETVTIATWKNIDSAQILVIDAGFQVENQMTLMHLNPADIKTPEKEQYFIIKSFADELSIDAFVESNRIAFAEDSSRLLEKTELEHWIKTILGFRADLQLAAIANHKIVGTVMSEFEEVKTEDSIFRRAWIYGLGVIPDARRRGIATHLLNELSRRLCKYGVIDIWVLTDLEGPIRSFYEAVGFTYQTDLIEFVYNFDLS